MAYWKHCIMGYMLLLIPVISTADAVKPLNNQSLKSQLHIGQSLIEVKNHFKQKTVELDRLLLTEHKALKSDPKALENFVNQKILTLWSLNKTLKGLVGGKTWKKLSQNEKAQLKLSFNETIHRYVREGMAFYDGQRVKLVNVQINNEKGYGMLTLELSPVYLPAFNINFKLTRSDDQWLIYDILIQGISYVKSKRTETRRVIKNNGIQALIDLYNKKNQQTNTSKIKPSKTEASKDKTSKVKPSTLNPPNLKNKSQLKL